MSTGIGKMPKKKKDLKWKARSMYSSLKSRGSIEVKQKLIEQLIQVTPECVYCEEEIKIRDVSCDHVVPLSRGGAHLFSNIQVVHKRCNNLKGELLHSEVMGLLKWLDGQTQQMKDDILMRLRAGSFRFKR